MLNRDAPSHGSGIVSLIASATEIICALGLRQRLLGVSHECDYPADAHGLPVLSAPKIDPGLPGGEIDSQVRAIVREGLSVYRVDVTALERLAPGLVVTQDQCEVCAVSLRDVEDALCAVTLDHTRICSLHPESLADIKTDFQRVAVSAGVPDRAEELIRMFDMRCEAVGRRTADPMRPWPRIALVEWLDPPMVAGGWMPEVATIAGTIPVIVEEPRHFEAVTWQDLTDAEPDLVIFLPCGYGVERTLRELDHPETRAGIELLRRRTRAGYVVDGNAYFNRPGPRIADSVELLGGLAHPELCRDFARSYAHAVRRVW